MHRLVVPVLLVFFLLMIFVLTMTESLWISTQVVNIAELSGTVDVQLKGKKEWMRLDPKKLGTKNKLKKGDLVRTGADGRVVLVWINKTKLLLDENTTIEVKACEFNERNQRSTSVFDLKRGLVWLRVRTKILPGSGSTFEVLTPHLVASVRGTIFSVSADDVGSQVTVHDGVVEVTAAKQRVEVKPGELAQVQKDAPPTTGKMTQDEIDAWNAQKDLLKPLLSMQAPLPYKIVHSAQVKVRGTTDPGSTILVNKQPAVVNEDGTFSTVATLQPGKNTITVVSLSPEKAATTATREVTYEP